MLGVKRLEEKIAETKDPIARKQLQELLDKRKKEEKQIWQCVIAVAAALLLYIIAMQIMNAYFQAKDHQMKIEHIRWQREMLDH